MADKNKPSNPQHPEGANKSASLAAQSPTGGSVCMVDYLDTEANTRIIIRWSCGEGCECADEWDIGGRRVTVGCACSGIGGDWRAVVQYKLVDPHTDRPPDDKPNTPPSGVIGTHFTLKGKAIRLADIAYLLNQFHGDQYLAIPADKLYQRVSTKFDKTPMDVAVKRLGLVVLSRT